MVLSIKYLKDGKKGFRTVKVNRVEQLFTMLDEEYEVWWILT